MAVKGSLSSSKPKHNRMAGGKGLPTTGVEEALQSLLSRVCRVETETVSLEQAEGRVLARALSSSENHPEYDTSAMDGYAVRVEDLREASEGSPVSLTLTEDVRAGFSPQEPVAAGRTSRISTGGLVPDGADAVVMRELVTVGNDGTVTFSSQPEPGLNIRCAGEHITAGEEILPEGTVLTPPCIGMAAFLGAAQVECFRPVRVAVLATGSELVKAGEKLAKGQIRDSNSVALSAAVAKLGCEVTYRTCVPDTEEDLDRALGEAFQVADVVITSGGISAGWHDLVRARIERLGGEFAFHKLRMRPGKPLAFGTCGEARFFCLPGNPVSSLVTFEVFVKPALLKMMGRPHQPETRTAVLEEPIKKKAGFSIFFRGICKEDERGALTVRLTGPQGSHMLRSLVEANCLIRTREESELLSTGDKVEVWPYRFV